MSGLRLACSPARTRRRSTAWVLAVVLALALGLMLPSPALALQPEPCVGSTVDAPDAPVWGGDCVRLWVFQLDSALIQLALGNRTSRPQEFRLRFTLFRRDGSVVTTSTTNVVRLEPREEVWSKFNVRNARGAVRVSAEVLFESASVEPPPDAFATEDTESTEGAERQSQEEQEVGS